MLYVLRDTHLPTPKSTVVQQSLGLGGWILYLVSFSGEHSDWHCSTVIKKPMDTVELFENKISAIIAQPALMSQLYTFGAGLAGLSAAKISAASAHGPLLASIALPGELLGVLTAGVGFIAFAAVWLCSHTINVFILISPWGGVDNVLRTDQRRPDNRNFWKLFCPGSWSLSLHCDLPDHHLSFLFPRALGISPDGVWIHLRLGFFHLQAQTVQA